MTDPEKELLQAKHRLEEAQARDRVKERKARTHRLIQIGAIFVKVCPELAYMDLKELETRLCEAMEKNKKRSVPGNRDVSLFPEGRTYSPPRWGGGISVGNRALSEGDAASAEA